MTARLCNACGADTLVVSGADGKLLATGAAAYIVS